MSRKQMAREHRKMRARGEILELVDYWRPKSRSECLEMERPCLYVSCRHHLFTVHFAKRPSSSATCAKALGPASA